MWISLLWWTIIFLLSLEKIDSSPCACELLVGGKKWKKILRSPVKTCCKSVRMTFSSVVISIPCLKQDILGNRALTLLGLWHYSAFSFVPTSNQISSNPSAICKPVESYSSVKLSPVGAQATGLSIYALPSSSLPPSNLRHSTPVLNKNKLWKRHLILESYLKIRIALETYNILITTSWSFWVNLMIMFG